MLLLFLATLPIVCIFSANNGCDKNGNLDSMEDLKLNLPAGVNNSYVSGFLPLPGQWNCSVSGNNNPPKIYTGAHGVFVSYYDSATDIVIGVGTSKSNSSWGMYFFQKNAEARAIVRICKWGSFSHPNYAPDVNTQGRECLFNSHVSFTFVHNGNEIVGATWSGDKVVLYTRTGIRTFFVPDADLWDVVSIRCKHSGTCAHQVITTPSTVIVSTGVNGLITNYSVCNNCSGFPQHVFAVGADGTIPPSFEFENWFYLTNSSSPVSGRFSSVQPLQLSCLWPIPALLGNTLPVYFNMSRNDAKCNGFKADGVVDSLRFALNFSDERAFAREGVISLETVGNTYNFTCTNSSTPNDGSSFVLPFGVTDQAYYCFMTFYLNRTANLKTTVFAGMLPPVVREFVVMRNGDFYLNGFRVFSVGQVVSARFNISSNDSRDFWTVAFAKNAPVLVDINSTNIQQLLYCNSPLNVIKCQQLRFNLDNGFYSYAPETANNLPRSFVRLPKYMTHSVINVSVAVSYDVVNKTNIGLYAWRVSFADDWLGYERDNRTTVCADTASFTMRLIKGSFSYGDVYVDIWSGECPFSFAALNNYLSFGSICFSLVPNGGCAMSIVTRGSYGEPQKFAALYVSFSEGDNVIGVPKAPLPGVLDMSEVHYNVCTSYTIYGHTGRGVISRGPVDYVSGLYYTSPAGDLLAYKNSTTGEVFMIQPCQFASQVAVVSDAIVGVASSSANSSIPFNDTVDAGRFYYHFNNVTEVNGTKCEVPTLTYGGLGICADGKIVNATRRYAAPEPISPVVTGNISVPMNFSFSVQVEYIQIMLKPVTVDCSVYVCNGNPRCLQLLSQYASACKTIEQALQLSARLESVEVNSMVAISDTALNLGVISNFDNTFNLSNVLPANVGGKSVIEDLLFDKVVTSGLGTVDTDYKACAEKMANTIAEAGCVQYYNGIMVLPGVVDQSLLGQYTAALTGAMVMGGITAAAAIPFSIAVQSRLNYLALQTDVLQRNQQILAQSFNSAMGNITNAFENVGNAIEQTSQGLQTVAQALDKVQNAVNEQGNALSHLTKQLASNFQAISASIEDLYVRLGQVEADQQVDRLITGRLAALNAFVSQQLTKYTDVRASRQLAQEKINECVKSQSFRYGFCGNGTHVFSVANAAPDGIMFFHSVLLPTAYAEVNAYAGLCVDDKGYVLRDPGNVLFQKPGNETYLITPRRMFEPRIPQMSDFVQISGCNVSYVNVSSENLPDIVPDFMDVNATIQDILDKLQNYSKPDFGLDIFNATYLNLSAEINDLTNRSQQLQAITEELRATIANINGTLVDLEWLNRVETYIKWPWYVWLAIAVALIVLTGLMLWCCLSTGCCGCCSCMASTLDFRGSRLQQYEVEKVHIQ
uniref:Spike protein n=1 Tax=Bat Coronavirus MsGD16 TaxID=3018863 RepID=A0AA49IAN6_9NIDO|nr:spike protein [Bat Coronavirus MsGD16]